MALAPELVIIKRKEPQDIHRHHQPRASCNESGAYYEPNEPPSLVSPGFIRIIFLGWIPQGGYSGWPSALLRPYHVRPHASEMMPSNRD